MQLFDPNNPNEKKKMIAAGVLAVGAIVVLGYVFLGGSSKKPANRASASPTPTPSRSTTTVQTELPTDDLSMFQPIVYNGTVPAVSEADRNIFSYYEPPPRREKPLPPATPVPTPPLTILGLSPTSVFARTGDFSLQVMGEKFVPGVNITVDGRVMQTRFINPQQVATTITSDFILNPGNRQIMVKNGDGSLYSNNVSLSVTPPPVPNYNYIGFIGKPRFNDMAVLQDKGNKDLLNVQRGDLIGQRFRVNSISAKEVVVIDTNLKIKHTLGFTADPSGRAQPRPTIRITDDDP